MGNNKKKSTHKNKNNKAVIIMAVVVLVLLVVCVFLIVYTVKDKALNVDSDESESVSDDITAIDVTTEEDDEKDNVGETTTQSTSTSETTTVVADSTTASAQQTTTVSQTSAATTSSSSSYFSATLIDYPSDTASWQLICLNTSRRVDSSVENSISLSYVAGSSQRMDSRAAAAYEKMYSAAAADGIYLTPCSGYRSYSTQERLYNEFVNDYLNEGYSQQEAEQLASRRRMPAGSSEHNIGICMDIITASSSYGFENTSAYEWLQANAADYGFILRYPSDKTDITGVKFEPWHWRYVGVENASSIKNSGLCLEEYLGLA